jgi:hypothetical protein
MEQTDHKTIYEIYFKSTVTYKAETWTLTNRNKSKFQIMDMKFLRSTEGRRRRDRITNEIFGEEIGI